MDIDPLEIGEQSENAATSAANARLNTWIAITIALLSTFLAVCKVKDDNIVQAMQQAQADKLDHWNYYQARNLREDMARGTVTQLTLAAVNAPVSTLAAYQNAIATYTQSAAEQARKKDELKAAAENDQRTYDSLNYVDDQFDLADALTALAISLLAMAALTHQRWLFGMALVPVAFAVLMGLAGLVGWHIHSDFIARLLS